MVDATFKKNTSSLSAIEPLIEMLNKVFDSGELPTFNEIKALGPDFQAVVDCIALGLKYNSAMSEDKIAKLHPELSKKISGSDLIHLSNIYISALIAESDKSQSKQPSTSTSKPMIEAPSKYL